MFVFREVWHKTEQPCLELHEAYFSLTDVNVIVYGSYPKDPRKLTGVSTRTHFVQIALTPKQAGLTWTFFYHNNSLGQVIIK